jgi:integrase
VWCTNPVGELYRKYVKRKTYEETQQAWFKLREQASKGPVASDVPELAEFLGYWLEEIVEPNLSPKTYEKYEMFARLHIIPYLGSKRLDKLQVKDVRQWLNKLARVCQCCDQGKDAARPEGKQRCCAIGRCCESALSPRSRSDARDTLRAALACAIEDDEATISRNVAAVVRLPAARKRKRHWWSVDDARKFLESARRDGEALYAAYVLILVLGLRKGEVLGLTWELVNLDAGELCVAEQVQRVGRQLLRREVKTEASEAPLPLPDVCVVALKLRKEQQHAARHAARCWPRSMCTRAWPWRSSVIARLRSRWRFTPRCRPRPPGTLLGGWASGWAPDLARSQDAAAALWCCTKI